MRYRSVGAGAVCAALLVLPPGASASPWSPSRDVARGSGTVGDIASDGTSAVAWRPYKKIHRLSELDRRRLLVVATSSGGSARFGAPRLLARTHADTWAVAVAPRGALLVAWQDIDGLHAAVRRRAGRPIVTRRIARAPVRRRDLAGNVRIEAVADPMGGWVIATSTSEDGLVVRAMSLDATGRPLTPAQKVAAGYFSQGSQHPHLAVDANGRAVLALRGAGPDPGGYPTGPALVSVRPHGAAFTPALPLTLPGTALADEEQVAVGADGRALVAFLKTRGDLCGEAGCRGAPQLTMLATDGQPQPSFGPSLAHPSRVLQPAAAFTRGGRGVLVFLLKDRPEPFVEAGPVNAVSFTADGRFGALQRLDGNGANQPHVVSVAGGRALSVWTTRLGRGGFRAALAAPDGRFHAIAAPRGRTSEGGCCSSLSLKTTGRWVLVGWDDADGHVRVAVRRL